MFNQNRLIRQHALGKFGPFLHDMSKDAAMIVWLDNNSNVKAHPNENYAREVMELFSLGVGHYTEKDIREAARAFTGWHTNGGEFDFNARFHDDGEKTVLGQTGNWNGDDVLDILLKRADCAEFLVRKLYRTFVSELQDPPAKLLAPLAESFRKTDYDIADLVRRMLSSRHFFSAHAYPSKDQKPRRVRPRRGADGVRRPAAAAAAGGSAGTDGAAALRPAQRQGLARRPGVAEHVHRAGPRQLRPGPRHGRHLGARRRAARSSSTPAVRAAGGPRPAGRETARRTAAAGEPGRGPAGPPGQGDASPTRWCAS